MCHHHNRCLAARVVCVLALFLELYCMALLHANFVVDWAVKWPACSSLGAAEKAVVVSAGPCPQQEARYCELQPGDARATAAAVTGELGNHSFNTGRVATRYSCQALFVLVSHSDVQDAPLPNSKYNAGHAGASRQGFVQAARLFNIWRRPVLPDQGVPMGKYTRRVNVFAARQIGSTNYSSRLCKWFFGPRCVTCRLIAFSAEIVCRLPSSFAAARKSKARFASVSMKSNLKSLSTCIVGLRASQGIDSQNNLLGC